MLVRNRPFLFHPQTPLPDAEVSSRLALWTLQFTGEGAFCPRCSARHPATDAMAEAPRKRRLLHCGHCQRFFSRERWYAPRRPLWM